MISATALGESLYVLRDRRGRRGVIYRPEAIGTPFDHEPGRWYFVPDPVPPGTCPGPAFDTAEAGERAAREALDGGAG